MNTRHLEEFLLFAEELNYTTAAEKLFITRPTLVEHLRGLEAELECKLVASDQRQAALTPAGRRFVQTARATLGAWERTRDEYRALADNLLTVTVASSNLPWLETILYRARRAIHEKYPYKRVEIAVTSGTYSSVEALTQPDAERAAGRAEAPANDIVVAGFKSYLCEKDRPPLPDGLRAIYLCTEPILLLMTQEHPLFGRERIAAADLDGAEFVLPPDIFKSWSRDRVAERFAERGARVTLRTFDFSSHSEYFSYEFGTSLGIVPTTLVPRYGLDGREEFRTFSAEDFPLETSFFAVVTSAFAQSENGGLLFEEMGRAAAGR